MQRINRYPSPLTPLINDGTGNIKHGDYDVVIDNLEAGTYVFEADVQNSGTQTGANMILFNSAWGTFLIYDKIGHVKTTLTLKKSDRLVIRSNQVGVTISNVIVERADTYAIAAGGGGLPGLLHQGHGSILTSRPVVGCENRESMAGPALRKQGRHLERDTGIRHHSEERRLLGIHPSQGRILHPASAGRMHDDAAQPAQLMELHTAGAGGYAAHGEWGSRHGHHQRRNKECYWHPCACRHQDHSDGHVRRRSGRMADTAGGRSARLRSRHRTILNVPGVAA